MTVLEKVKTNLGITGDYQDALLRGYIDEVKQYMLDAGVAESIVEAETSAGIITRGVADLWNYGSGGTSLSQYFMQRIVQLALKRPEDSAAEGEPAESEEVDDGEL